MKRLEEFQAGIPGCVDRALDKNYWVPALRTAAEKALRAQFALFTDAQTSARYAQMLPRILDTLMLRVTPGTRTFEMWLPADTISDVNIAAAAKYASLQWTPLGRQKKYAFADVNDEQNLAMARQAILDWVTLEKQWDERDAGKTPEQIAERIETLLGLRPAYRERNQEMEEAAESLRGAIEAWLAGDSETPGGGHAVSTPATDPARQLGRRPSGLTNAQARQWLEAVLQTWVVYFQIHIKDRVEDEIKKLWKKVKSTQPDLI